MSENDFVILLMALAVIQFGIGCLYLRNLNSLLKAIRPANRNIAPGQVWVLLLWGFQLVLDLLRSDELGHLYLLNTDKEQRAYTIMNGIVMLLLLIWQFRITSGIALSIEQEYKSRNLPVSYRPTYYLGLIMGAAALASLGILFRANHFVHNIGRIGSFSYLIAWIIYWVKTYRYKKKIQAMPEDIGQGGGSVFSNLY